MWKSSFDGSSNEKTGKNMSLKKIFMVMLLSALPIMETMADGVRFLIVNAKDGIKTVHPTFRVIRQSCRA